MKLWILRPKPGLVTGDNPWEPWYDKAFGFVVRAETENEARCLAHDEAGEENDNDFLGKTTANTTTPWLDSKYSTCKELTADGSRDVILRHFASA